MSKNETDKFYEAEQIVEKKARNFFEKNSKIIAGATIGLILVIIGGYGYKQLILAPKESKAQTIMITAQQYFEVDSFNLALNGDSVSLGFKAIADQYSGTKAGNGAKLYAGISALHTGDFEGAIKFLESFSTDDALLNARKYGCIGDAKSELNDMTAAADFYQKAVNADPENIISAPFYLYRLAKAQIVNNKSEDAAKTLQTIVDKFEDTQEGALAVKELALLQAQ